MMMLNSLERPEKLAKLAYDALLESILSGRLTPREVYNEKMLAIELGISRTPVREALLELAVQGLVTFLPRKGVVVNCFSPKDVDEIFEVRKAIEMAVVEKLASLAPGPDLECCRIIIENQNRAIGRTDKKAFLEADRAFHLCLGELTGNRRIVIMLENLRNMVALMGAQALHTGDRDKTVLEEHRRIVRSIAARQSSEARQLVFEHLEKSKEAVKTFIG